MTSILRLNDIQCRFQFLLRVLCVSSIYNICHHSAPCSFDRRPFLGQQYPRVIFSTKFLTKRRVDQKHQVRVNTDRYLAKKSWKCKQKYRKERLYHWIYRFFTAPSWNTRLKYFQRTMLFDFRPFFNVQVYIRMGEGGSHIHSSSGHISTWIYLLKFISFPKSY